MNVDPPSFLFGLAVGAIASGVFVFRAATQVRDALRRGPTGTP
jgi:hypothetical protein